MDYASSKTMTAQLDIPLSGTIRPGERDVPHTTYAPIVDSDSGSPTEDEMAEPLDFPTDEAQSVIGVSIGRAQSRLTSPKTPAAERAAAMEQLEGGGLFDGAAEQMGEDDALDAEQQVEEMVGTGTRPAELPSLSERLPSPQIHRSPDATLLERLPSPWKAGPLGPKQWQRTDESRKALRPAFATRRRSSSGGMTEALRRYLPFKTADISSAVSSYLPHHGGRQDHTTTHVAPTSRSPVSRHDSGSPSRRSPRTYFEELRPPRRATVQAGTSGEVPMTSSPEPIDPSEPDPSIALTTIKSKQSGSGATGTRSLRRSTSDNSLIFHRTISRASSLGDDTRFENVSEQVNSRLKAIKDSFQDANFKLPSLPAMSNFNFGSFLPEQNFGRGAGRGRGQGPDERRRETINVNRFSAQTNGANGTSNAEKLGLDAANAEKHPFFTRALAELEGDVVVMGGYRGSILRSAEYPHRQLWVPIKVGLNLRKVDLEIGLEPEAELTVEERIIPGGMLTHIGPVDISRRLLKRLRHSENAKNGKLRVHEYGYDWRLSPHLLSKKLLQFLEALPCNAKGTPAKRKGATVIAHSLGGLLTRHAINERPDLVSAVVYAGVPTTCVNILGPLRHGDNVLLSSKVLTAQVNFTIRTSFALLPLNGRCFIDKVTKEEYPVDFFDPQTWIEYCLSPCVAPALPSEKQPQPTGMAGLVSSMASVLPSFSSRRLSLTNRLTRNTDSEEKTKTEVKTTQAEASAEGGAPGGSLAPQMHANRGGDNTTENSNHPSPGTTVTLPREACIAYLTRTLAEIKQFKQELDFKPVHQSTNSYPPAAVIYGKTTPTVYGAKVDGREGIKRADAYDELAFASGDGVVLARAAMLPEGYQVVRGGIVSSDRGHVTLLGDLEAVGKCLTAVMGARRKGVGMGR